MKLCRTCGQTLAESIRTCPSCGMEAIEGLTHVDGYRILEIIREGYTSILCRAVREEDDTQVALRLFTVDSGVDEKIAGRLRSELEELRKLPGEWFVHHYSINCSADGLWYRVSEWLDAQSWGDLLGSGRLQKLDVAYDLFHRLAAILDGLHKSGHVIPHLTLNDILILKGLPDRVDIKLDYKLSRFLNPRMARPDPLLQNLLDCHPDIIHGRPLDRRSDVWSLGAVFAQILTADLELRHPATAIKQGNFPKEISILIRSMLTDDPDLRPRSMAEVAEALERIIQQRKRWKTTHRHTVSGEIRSLKKMFFLFGLCFTLLASGGAFFLYRIGGSPTDAEAVFSEYADSYAGSVAFVMVEYSIKTDDVVLYNQRTEGTAFLVDKDGYLLTNRHVACPWLEDEEMYKVIHYLSSTEQVPQFDYRIYLWFEGTSAFNRLLDIGKSKEAEDVYDLMSAFRLDGEYSVEIAGVALSPARKDQIIKAPLRDDFAVLKINPVPEAIRALPLARKRGTKDLKRLAPIMALGFPLGRNSQEDTINVSVTRGHVRRTFENFFQVDSSIYKGNSGGPIIDEHGQVVGIVSAVATDVAVAPLPVITPLSDIGLVLPVGKAAGFIDEIKAGQRKWDGVLDFSAAKEIRHMTDAAFHGNWADAVGLAREKAVSRDTPSMLVAAAMMFYCTGDYTASRRLFDTVLSIDPDRYLARLMRYLIDRRHGGGRQSPDLSYLLSLDWQSPGEFFGHIARLLKQKEPPGRRPESWNTSAEKGWLYYIAAIRHLEKNSIETAETLLKLAAASSQRDEWSFYLALAAFDRLGTIRGDGLEKSARLRRMIEKGSELRKKRAEEIETLRVELKDRKTAPDRKSELMHQSYLLERDNKKLLAYAAYQEAMHSRWPQALKTANTFLQLPGREDPIRLGTTLLQAGLLRHLGENGEARLRLQHMADTTAVPWYRQICLTLLGERSKEELIESAGNVPEKVLTALTALGFQAEAMGNEEQAVRYYREALGSYLDDWIEYSLARQRYVRLRGQPPES